MDVPLVLAVLGSFWSASHLHVDNLGLLMLRCYWWSGLRLDLVEGSMCSGVAFVVAPHSSNSAVHVGARRWNTSKHSAVGFFFSPKFKAIFVYPEYN
jgi:hypothetical protein